MVDLGYEDKFAFDINNDGSIGNNQSLGGTPLGSAARFINIDKTIFYEQSDINVTRKDELTGQEFELTPM